MFQFLILHPLDFEIQILYEISLLFTELAHFHLGLLILVDCLLAFHLLVLKLISHGEDISSFLL
mgnify:FL=1